MLHFSSWKIKHLIEKKDKKRAHSSIRNTEQPQCFKISIEFIRNQLEDSSPTAEKLFIVCELSASRQYMIMHMFMLRVNGPINNIAFFKVTF